MTTPTDFRSALGRAFSCWPSRLGAVSLIALALSWGSDELGARSAAERPVVANAHPH